MAITCDQCNTPITNLTRQEMSEMLCDPDEFVLLCDNCEHAQQINALVTYCGQSLDEAAHFLVSPSYA